MKLTENDIASMRTVADKALFDVKPCELVKYHAPDPVMTDGHHIHPVFLQNRLFGHIIDNELKWLCGNCHDSVHAWLYWLLEERKVKPRVGRAATAEAERSFKWYRDNGGKIPSDLIRRLSETVH